VKSETFIAGMLAGAGLLLLVKYGIVGLDAWNSVFHPERNDPAGAFSKPLLGVLSCCH
jgi:hypothetical protein